MRYFVFLGASIVLNAGSYVLYKSSSLNATHRLVSTLLLLAGLVIGAANATLYTRSLKGIALNTAYPIFSAGSLFLVTIVSVLVFHEAMSLRKVLGVGVLVVGVLLLSV